MDPLLNTAVEAAQDVGQKLRSSFARGKFSIEEKLKNDFVTSADKFSEEILVNAILDRYPNHYIISEEQGNYGNENSEMQWIIDPLDGTTNFIYGIPHFAISIACYINERPHCACIYDPIKEECFTATHKQGAFLNNTRIRIRSNTSLAGSLLATGIPFNRTSEETKQYLELLERLLSQSTKGIRRMGAASLDLAYVAASRMDGFWEQHLKPWDIAAGSIIVKEAGGLVTDFDAGEHCLSTGAIVAGNSNLVRELLRQIKG